MGLAGGPRQNRGGWPGDPISLLKNKRVLLDANENPIIDDVVYQSIDSFVAGPLAQYVISRGHRLRGSSDVVKCSSRMWIPDAATDDEVHLARIRLSPDLPA